MSWLSALARGGLSGLSGVNLLGGYMRSGANRAGLKIPGLTGAGLTGAGQFVITL